MTFNTVTREAVNFINAVSHNEMLGSKIRAFKDAGSFVMCEVEDSAPDRNGLLVILKDLDNKGVRYKGLVFGEVSPFAIILGEVDDRIDVIKEYKAWVLENLSKPQKGFKAGVRIEFSQETLKVWFEAKEKLRAIFGEKKLSSTLTKTTPFERKTESYGWTKYELDETMVVFTIKKLVGMVEQISPIFSVLKTFSKAFAIDVSEMKQFAEERARAIKAADKKK